MADKASEYGIELADISDEAKDHIPQRRTAILTNPFDTAGASRSPGFLSAVCKALAADNANDCMLMYLGPLAVRHDYARNFAAASAQFGKPAAAIIMLSEADVRDIFQAHHVPVFDAATDPCLKMLRAYIDYGHFLKRRRASLEVRPSGRLTMTAAVGAILEPHVNGSLLPHSATTELLRAYGFECVDYQLVSSSDDAEAAANKLGYPVIIKGMVADLAHRSDAGLVSRKISNDDELQAEFSSLYKRLRNFGQEEIKLNVERFVPHDHEVILGVKYDATFGPVILCGLGGIFTEILKDYTLRVAPLGAADAMDMLSSLKAYPTLRKTGANGSQIDSLVAAILRLADLAVDLRGKISAVDINPIGISSDSDRITVLDAKIHL